MQQLLFQCLILLISSGLHLAVSVKAFAQTKRGAADKVIVITGASSGLGRGIALKAGQQQNKVILIARNSAVLQEVVQAIQAQGSEAMYFAADITDAARMKEVTDSIYLLYHHVDVWINNAGVTVFGKFWEVPVEEHERVVAVNLQGSMRCAHLILQQFMQQGYGQLITIASAESELPTAFQASYAATKAGLKSMHQVMRQELRLYKHRNIAITVIDPWAMNTPIWDNAANHTNHAPQLSTMDHTDKVVNIVMRAIHKSSNRDIAAGWKTKLAYTAQRLLPHLTTRIANNLVYKHQIKDSPGGVAATSGNLFQVSQHNAVQTDIKQRMKRQKKERKKKRL